MRYYDPIIVYLAGVTGMWKALPVGFILKVPPFYIGLMTTLGALTCNLIIYYFGKRVQRFFYRFYSEKTKDKKEGRIRKLSEQYGCPGLGLLGTLFMGQPVVMLLGMIVVKRKRNLLLWVSIGTVIWSISLTIAGSYGLRLFD